MNLKQTMTKTACGLAAFTLITGAAFSYFTDKEQKRNTFTIGDVDIDLEEPSWPGDDPNDDSENCLVPGEVVHKDPTVSNTGENDGYVYLEVTLPKAMVVTANEDGSKNEAANVALFTYETNDGWTQLEEYTKEDQHTITYVYAYDEVLAKGEKTNPLFDEVAFINIIEGQDIDLEQHIDVVAKAIQAAGVGDVREAYVKLNNQL